MKYRWVAAGDLAGYVSLDAVTFDRLWTILSSHGPKTCWSAPGSAGGVVVSAGDNAEVTWINATMDDDVQILGFGERAVVTVRDGARVTAEHALLQGIGASAFVGEASVVDLRRVAIVASEAGWMPAMERAIGLDLHSTSCTFALPTQMRVLNSSKQYGCSLRDRTNLRATEAARWHVLNATSGDPAFAERRRPPEDRSSSRGSHGRDEMVAG